MRAPRTLLFVPADRPERIPKALSSNADAVVIDFEDGVLAAGKLAARTTLKSVLVAASPPRTEIMVRVNGTDTPWFQDDVAALCESEVAETVESVVLPKCHGPEAVAALDAELTAAEATVPTLKRMRIVATIESAAGVLASAEVASASRRVRALLFGAADLSAELGIAATPCGEEFAYARSHVVLAAASRGIVALDGPYLHLDDDDGLATSVAEAARLGFAGKAAIHPAQLPVIDVGFGPREDELKRAASIVRVFESMQAEDGPGAVRLDDGSVVDYPVYHRAKRLLDDADPDGGRG